MKYPVLRLIAICLLTAIMGGGIASAADQNKPKTRVLLVTGGHDFEKAPFFKVFKDNTNITFTAVEQPKSQDFLKPDEIKNYDVVVLYDLWQDISEEAKTNFVTMLRQGKGLVALHHCIASYQKWGEYEKIVGGKYHLDKWTENGVEKSASTYKHDVDVPVKVADSQHPVTRGVRDFTIHDETYGGFTVLPGMMPLLTTEEPTSSKTIAWVHEYEKAHVVYIELGHDHLSYQNPNFQKLVANAIQWAASK